MGYEATEQVIYERFQALWPTLQPTVPYTFENQGELNSHSKDKPWVRLTVLQGNSSQVEMGNKRRWRRPGVVEIQIFLPTGDGTGMATELADTVRDIYEGSTISGVLFRATSLGPGTVDGPWRQYNVTTPFQADELN